MALVRPLFRSDKIEVAKAVTGIAISAQAGVP